MGAWGTRRLAILVCVEGLSRYITAFRRDLRLPVRTGRRGRPRRVLPEGFLLGQVVKQYAQRRVTGVVPPVKHGTLEAIARTEAMLTAGTGRKWLEQTPAMAAGLADHPWTMCELLGYQVPLPAWVAPKRRGRPPKMPPAALVPVARPPAVARAAWSRFTGVPPARQARDRNLP